jgi:hypothetical protein
MACRANAMAMGALEALMERVRNDSAAKPDTVAPAVLDGVKNVLNALEGIDRRLARLEKSAKARGRLDAEADEAEPAAGARNRAHACVTNAASIVELVGR